MDRDTETLWTKNLIWILVIQVLYALVYHGYATLIPFVQDEYILTKAEVGFLTSSMFIGSSLTSIPAGFITDKIGVRNTLTLFSLIKICVLFAFLITSSYLLILILLVFLGVGYGAVAPATNRGIMDEFTIVNRGTAMGIKQMGVPLGVVIATILLPNIAQLSTWRVSLFTVGIVFLIIIIVFFFKYQKGKNLNGINLSLKQIKAVFFNKQTILISVIISFFMIMQVSVTTFMVIYLYQSASYSLGFSTFCFSLLFCGGVIGRAMWGFVSDRFFYSKRKIVLFIIGILAVLFLFLFGFINVTTPPLLLALLSLFLGITTQGWNGISIIMIAEKAKKSSVGLTTGYGLTIINIGGVIGAPISGFIVDVSGSYQVMWWLIALIMFIVSILMLLVNIEENKKD